MKKFLAVATMLAATGAHAASWRPVFNTKDQNGVVRSTNLVDFSTIKRRGDLITYKSRIAVPDAAPGKISYFEGEDVINCAARTSASLSLSSYTANGALFKAYTKNTVEDAKYFSIDQYPYSASAWVANRLCARKPPRAERFPVGEVRMVIPPQAASSSAAPSPATPPASYADLARKRYQDYRNGNGMKMPALDELYTYEIMTWSKVDKGQMTREEAEYLIAKKRNELYNESMRSLRW